MDVRIRPAVREDAHFLAWVMQEAARSHLERGMWDLVFPGDEAERLGYLTALACTEPRSFCHHAGFWIAEADARPAAALSAYVPAQVGTPAFVQALRATLAAAGWSEARMRSLQEPFALFQSCTPDIPDDAWVLEWVAARPEFRRRGLVRALLEHTLETGRRAGHRTAVIGILIGNEPALRAYQKVGFRLCDERRRREFADRMGAPGTAQLRLELAAGQP